MTHHRKQGALHPWTAVVQYPGYQSFRLGTVHTTQFDAAEAKRLLIELAGAINLVGLQILQVERGALIYKPQPIAGVTK